MARLRIIVVAQETDGDVYALATCKFYQPGTATASGSSTSGTPFAGSLYAAISGGSPISTTQTLASNGTLVVWTDSKSRVDVGIEPAGGGTAFVRQYEAAELDPADVMTSVSGEQSVMQTGTLAAPGIAQTGNLDTGFNVDSGGDPAVVKDGVGILETISTTTYLRSPDGTDALTITDAGLVTAPRVLERYGVYNVLDHGVVTGSTSANAATNTTALQALWLLVAQAGGGIIYFPPCAAGSFYPFNATTLNHAQTSTYGISIVGAGRATPIKFYGTAGAFWAVATGSTSPIAQCTMENLYFLTDQNVASGAILEFGYTSRYLLRNVHVGFDGNALIGIRLSSQASLHVQDSTIIVRDAAGAACVDFRQSVATGGVWFTGCDLSGGGAANSNTVGLLFNNTALVDTVVLNSTLVKDHYRSIYSGVAGSGNVSNFQMNGGHLDAAQYNVFLNPVTGGDYENWQFTGVWFAATKSNIDLNVDNGGSITNFLVVGGYMSNATVGAVAVTRGVSGFQLDGVTIVADQTTDASYAAVEFYTAGGASPSNVRVTGCDITAGSTAAACVRISSGTTRFVLAFNILTGSTDADGLVINGALSSKRVVGDHVLPG